MHAPTRLPADLDPAAFDARFRHEHALWLPAFVELCAAHGLPAAPIVPFADGSNLVAAVGDRHVAKLFPPFHRNQWESEHRALAHLRGRLSIAVPRLVAHGERPDGWTWVIVDRLPGVSLDARWVDLEPAVQVGIVERIGQVMAEVHALPVGGLDDLPPRWDAFLAGQIAGCRARHARLGAPEWVTDHVERFVRASADALPVGFRPVLLTGEYTPFNLLVTGAPGHEALTGMIDFGDAMVGPAEYDLLGPCLFLAAGRRELLDALFRGYRGTDAPWDGLRRTLMLLWLLHRYASLDGQLRIPGWRDRVGSLEALEASIWPEP